VIRLKYLKYFAIQFEKD